MDFAKFSFLIESSSLFFPRATHLGDVFEGSFPFTQTPLARIHGLLPPGSLPAIATLTTSPGLVNTWEMFRPWTLVSCWHANEHESAAMWSLYGRSASAVAIRSTPAGLRAALPNPIPVPDGFFGDVLHIGMVDYIDYSSDVIPVQSFATPYYRKRKSFEHERELRAVLLQIPRHSNGAFNREAKPPNTGVALPVDLTVLLTAIYVAPQAPTWFAELARALVRRVGLNIEVIHSSLDASPLY
jgi:hypothetical protein